MTAPTGVTASHMPGAAVQEKETSSNADQTLFRAYFESESESLRATNDESRLSLNQWDGYLIQPSIGETSAESGLNPLSLLRRHFAVKTMSSNPPKSHMRFGPLLPT